MTNKFCYGWKALSPHVVERTWHGVLKDQDQLPEDCIKSTGVLVGIGECPPGQNR